MKNLTIRKITIKDLTKLQAIGKQTFIEAFSSDNTEEDMNDYLNIAFSTEQLQTQLTNKHSEFYFAELEDKIIGYLKINFKDAQTELKEENALEIERIYLLKAFYGQKIGQQLYEKAKAIAKQKNMDYIWLGVWKKNLKAIRFYKKNGFVEFDQHVFMLGNDKQIDIMMKVNLLN